MDNFWKLLPWALLILFIGGATIYVFNNGVNWGEDKTEMKQDKEQVAADKEVVHEQTEVRRELEKRPVDDRARILGGWVRD